MSASGSTYATILPPRPAVVYDPGPPTPPPWGLAVACFMVGVWALVVYSLGFLP